MHFYGNFGLIVKLRYILDIFSKKEDRVLSGNYQLLDQ